MRPETDTPLTPRNRLWFAAFLVWTLLIVAVVTTCAACAGQQLHDEMPTSSDPAVAHLMRNVDGKYDGACTIFKIGDDIAMTAGHCCGYDDPLDDIAVILGEPKAKHVIQYYATGPHSVPGAEFTVIYDEDEHDVCVMRGKLRGAPLKLGDYDPEVGERVWTAGYPHDTYLISDGIWSGRDELNRSIASVAVWPGSSGSPVLDSRSRVVGVIRAYFPPQSNLTIISPLEWVHILYNVASRK